MHPSPPLRSEVFLSVLSRQPVTSQSITPAGYVRDAEPFMIVREQGYGGGGTGILKIDKTLASRRDT